MAKIPYEVNHKIISETEYKLCNDCEEWFPMNSENFYKNKNDKKDGFTNYCKECWKKRVGKWQKNNNDKMRGYFKKCDSQEYRIKLKREYSKKQKESGYYKSYQQENKEKFKQYGFEHMHKKHDISDYEWTHCKKYFSYCCAYCGIAEKKAKKEYGHVLHMEHAYNNGANDITNCIPACRSCNSQKWIRDFEQWYNKENPIYNQERESKIIRWLQEDHLKITIN